RPALRLHHTFAGLIHVARTQADVPAPSIPRKLVGRLVPARNSLSRSGSIALCSRFDSQWVAVPCNVLAVAGLVLLIIDPANNLLAALALLALADVGLSGITTVMRKRRR